MSSALGSNYGRFACLTFDGLEDGSAQRLAPALLAQQVPATLCVATAGPSWRQLKGFLAQGWEIGSLGHDAVNLSEQSSSEQAQQVGRSAAALAAHFGAPPQVFAYPHGAYDATTVSCVKEAGFAAALTLKSGTNAEHADPFHLRRVPLSGALLPDLWMVLRTARAEGEAPALPPASPAPARGEASRSAALAR